MKKKLLLFTFVFSTVFLKISYSNSCTSNAGVFASWQAITWTCTLIPTSGPPGCGDVINLAAGTTVNVSLDVDYSACPTPIILNIYGTMNFNTNGVRFKLPPGSIVIVQAGGSIHKTFAGGGSSTLISVGGVDVWTAGDGTILGFTVLPIELLSFTATAGSNCVNLSWSTATETNNDYFTIERSTDDFNFEAIATIAGAGNSTSVVNYSAKDPHPLDGFSYYRLKQTDFNGASTYPAVVSFDNENSSVFSFDLFPNPNEGTDINLSINSEKGNTIAIVIYDVMGRRAYTKTIFTEKQGEDHYSLSFPEKLTSGIYMITATSQQHLLSKKMIVK